MFSNGYALIDEDGVIQFACRDLVTAQLVGSSSLMVVVITRPHGIGDKISFDERGYECATDDEIEALLREAIADGDLGTIRECQLALGIRTDGSRVRGKQLASFWIAELACMRADAQR